MASPILAFFAYDHLKTPQRSVSQKFSNLAYELERDLPDGPEKSIALRKLLEGKDAAVRASLGIAQSG